MSGHARPRGRPPHPDILTPAEWRVLEHVREGLTNAEIAERLGVSIHAVKFHVSNMLSKLNVETREELAVWSPPGRRRFLGLTSLLAAFGKFTPAAKLAAAFAVAGLGLAGVAAVIAAMSGSEDSEGSDVPLVAESSPTPPLIPDATPARRVTSFRLVQREHLDVNHPDGTRQRLDAIRTVYFRTPDEKYEVVEYLEPQQETSFGLAKGTVRWSWKSAGPVQEAHFAKLFGSPAIEATPGLGWPYPAPDLGELVSRLSGGQQVSTVSQDVLLGRPVLRISFSANRCQPEGYDDVGGPLTFWIDEETHFLLQMEQRSLLDGRVTGLQVVTELELDPALPDRLFEFPRDREILVRTADSPPTWITPTVAPAPNSDPGASGCPAREQRSMTVVTPASGERIATATPTP